MKKFALILALFVLIGTAAFSQDFLAFPDNIQAGNIMVSPLVNLGSYYGLAMLFGAGCSVEYALPIGLPIIVGGEASVNITTGYGWSPMAIPIMLKGSYHPNLGIENVDIYATLKLGYSLGMWLNAPSTVKGGGGFSYGTNLGARYFFSKNMAVYGELGWDYYAFTWKYSNDPSYHNWSYTYYMYKWLTAGVTLKM